MKNLLFIILILFSAILFAVTENTARIDNITTNNPAKITVDIKKDVDFQSTGGIYLPAGDSAQRPAPTKEGMLRYNASSATAEIYASGAWGSIGGGLSSWISAKSYLIGDVVIDSNKIYKCIVAHTSGVFATDLLSGDWVFLGPMIALGDTDYHDGIETVKLPGNTSTTQMFLTQTGDGVNSAAPSWQQLPSSGTSTYMLTGSSSDIGGYYQAVSLNNYTAGALLSIPIGASTTPALMGSFASNVGYPNITVIPVGLFKAHYELQKSAGSNNYSTYFELYKRSAGGVETLLGTSDTSSLTALNTVQSFDITMAVSSPISFLPTDRGVIKIYVVMATGSATVTLRADDATNSRIELPAATVDATNFVPYLGATKSLNLGTFDYLTSGSLGATGARLTKGWLTDLDVANTITGSISGNAGSATNIAGGVEASIPYQSAANTTSMLANGTAGQVLTSSGTTLAPTWTTPAGAGNLSGDVTSVGLSTSYSATVPLNKGGTGQITKIPAFDALSPMTAVGDIIFGYTAGTGQALAIGANTDVLRVGAGGAGLQPEWGKEDRANLLSNPNFENVTLAGWTCTTGTCTSTTTSGEFSEGAAAMKISLSAQAMDVSQTVNTVAGIQKQGYARGIYKVPSTLETFQVCSLVDGAEQACVPSANLILDNTYRSIEIPLIFGSASAGIKFKTSSDTGDAFVDGWVVAQGLSNGTMTVDTEWASYTPIFQGLGTPTSVDFYWKRSGDTMCVNGKFTSGTVTGSEAQIGLANSNTISIAAGTNKANGFMVRTLQNSLDYNMLMSSGHSYVGIGAPTAPLVRQAGNGVINNSESTSVNFCVPIQGWSSNSTTYSQASANYPRTLYTPTFTGFGTPSAVNCYHSREGEYLNIDCTFTAGTTTATEFRVSLPNSLTSQSNIPTLLNVGTMIDGTANVNNSHLCVLAEASKGYVTFGVNNPGNACLFKTSSTSQVVTGNTYSINARVPISGWSNSNVIVGSFADIIPKIIYLSDVKANNTNGGSSSATTTHVRNLNTLSAPFGDAFITDSASFTGTGASNTDFTLLAGTYRITAQAPACVPSGTRLRIRNTTDATTAIQGQSQYNDTSVGCSDATLDGIFTIGSSKTFQLQQYVTAAKATNGLGVAVNSGDEEIFAKVTIQKIK